MEHDLHPRDSSSKTVAWFASKDQMRAATVALERHGIDSMYIDMARTPSVTNRRGIDRSSMSWMGRRAAVGAVLGAMAGVVVGLVLGTIFDAEGMDLFAAVMGAVIFLTPIGGFLGLATRLPVTDEAFDTFGKEPEGEDWLSITGPKEVQDAARELLESLDAVRISAVGDDAGPLGPTPGA